MSGYLVRTGRHSIELPFGASYLGRSGECRVRLEAGLVSRRHARLDVETEGVFIEDLGSVNGTYVNGELVTERQRLSPGDLIVIGSEQLLLLAAGLERSGPRLPTPAPGSLQALAAAASAASASARHDEPLEDEPTQVGGGPPRARRSMGFFVTELVDKAITLGRHDEAGRLVTVIADSLVRQPLGESPGAEEGSFVELSLRLARASGQWVHIERVFEVAAQRRWLLPDSFAAAIEELAVTVRPSRGPGVVAYLHVMEPRVAGDPELVERLQRMRAVAARRPT